MSNRVPRDGRIRRPQPNRLAPLACGLAVAALLFASAASVTAAPAPGARTLSFDKRVAAQTAIEDVRWSHRIWPEGAGIAKPALAGVMPYDSIRAKVEDSLRKSNALERFWHRPITAVQLQAELDRMTKHSRNAGMLREIFAALNDDPFLIAECLARPALADRLARSWYDGDRLPPTGAAEVVPFDAWWAEASVFVATDLTPPAGSYTLTIPEAAACTPDTWRPTATPFVPGERGDHSAVWTGSEMIVWGGTSPGPLSCDHPPACLQNTGYRYDPATDTWSPTSTGVNVPDPRSGHSAVWTGTEMIVWGGWVEPGNSITGGRYDPSSNQWRPVSTVGAPSGGDAYWTGTEMLVLGSPPARYDPVQDRWEDITPAPSTVGYGSVVWTGRELITWGDGSPGTPGMGGRYDPAADSWTLTSTLNAPEARTNHVAVWTGTRMIVWGGRDTVTFLDLFDGGSYDPLTDSWSTITPAPDLLRSAYYTTRAVWTGSKMIVIHCVDAFMQWMGSYDPSSGVWDIALIVPDWPAIGEGFSMIWTGSEVIVWGCNGDSSFRNAGGRYDPVTGNWVRTGNGYNLLGARTGHTAVWTGSEMIVLGGSIAVVSPGWPPPYHGHRYDPATDTWTLTAVSAAFDDDRAFHTAVWTGTEMIVWGGYQINFNFPLGTGGRYNPMTNTWAPVSMTGSPSSRSQHTAVWTGRYMIVWGGVNGIDRLGTGGIYSPYSDTWRPMSVGINSPSARSGHTAVWAGSEMLVWGGNTGFDVYANSGARYNPISDTWKPIVMSASTPSARAKHSAAWTGKFMIVWGGTDALGVLGTGGIYSPSRDMWKPTATGANVPSPRQAHTSAWTGSEMIVWGGSDGNTYFDNGARYAPIGDKWLPMASAAGTIPARSEQTAVTTGSEMIVWGGFPFTNTGGAYCYAP